MVRMMEELESRKPSRLQLFLLWSSRGMLATGLVLLSLVAAATLHAKIYQADAKKLLQIEIQRARESKISHLQPRVEEGDVLGRLDIPRLGVSVAVLQGTDARTLRLGAGHVESTSLPGEAGNSGIAGHRDTFFRALKDIRRNDQIQLQTATGLFRYEVDWTKVVAPDEVTVLAPSTESALTLVTCYPFYFVGSAPKRFVVRAHKY
jgi:LPXTG-site transpeptidase (sortase) family protein